MISPVYMNGLNVEVITPSSHSADVDVNSIISVSFNSDLDSSTVLGNISLLKDDRLLYDMSGVIDDVTKYKVIECILTYKDKTVVLKPKQSLDIGSRYIILVDGKSIKDITNNTMIKEYVSFFYTEVIATAPKSVLVNPKLNDVVPYVAEFQWQDQSSPAYVLHLSKFSTFENLLIDTLIKSDQGMLAPTIYENSLDLEDGLFYWRVKSIDGNWSDIQQFFVKKHDKVPVSHGDVIIEDVAESIINGDETFEILETFPNDNDTGVPVNLNIIYIKVRGEVDQSIVDKNFVNLTYEPIEEDEESDVYTESTVNYTTTIVYDSASNVSYIIFTLKPIT